MTCLSCGTQIADKALICFRCGQATTAPRVAPPPSSGSIFDTRRRVGLPTRVAWVAGVIAGIAAAYAAWAALAP
jgi:uncharacterized membrane protein YvbJ